ncbi:hypothetical protein, partial [Clavibacter michiganensis]|uniref:hypothetical protein n=1 Tax=Clavibacter michiganensis TaxID=28447 RepID=UPI00209BF27C
MGTFVCARCGLDVRAPEAAALLGASRRVVDAITERERLLEAMRRWSEAAARTRAATVIASPVPATAPEHVPALPDALETATTVTSEAATDAVVAPPAP